MMREMDINVRIGLTLLALALAVAVVFYVPFIVALPLLGAIGFGVTWVWRRRKTVSPPAAA